MQEKAHLHVLYESSSKKVLDEIQLQNSDVKMLIRLCKKKERKNATKTCIIWDHDEVCRESPPIFIEISGDEPYWYDKVILVQKPSDS